MNRIAGMITGILAVLGILYVALMNLSGAYLSPEYKRPLEESYHRRFKDPRLQVLAHALAAPHPLNRQPWKVRLDRGAPLRFSLSIDSRRLTYTGSKEIGVGLDQRSLLLSQGILLEYVRVAATRLGYTSEIKLFPGGKPGKKPTLAELLARPIAQVSLTKFAADEKPPAGKLYADLYGAIFPSGNRPVFAGAYEPGAPSKKQIKYLQNLAKIDLRTRAQKDEKVKKTDKDDLVQIKIYTKKSELKNFRELLPPANRVYFSHPGIRQELYAALRLNEEAKNRLRDGIPLAAGLPGQQRRHGAGTLPAYLATARATLNPPDAAEWSESIYAGHKRLQESSPVFVLLRTIKDSPVKRVESGMVYARLFLALQTLGKDGNVWHCALENQILHNLPGLETYRNELNELYAKKARRAKDQKVIQAILSLGKIKPQPEAGALSPRRDLRSILTPES